MTSIGDLSCPPYDVVAPLPADASILDYASAAQHAVNAYRHAMDTRADFRATVAAAARLSRATQALVTAIADDVAQGHTELSAMDLWRREKGPRPGTKPGYW